MGWGEFFQSSAKGAPIWAALCTGLADGSNPKYLAQVRHPILVMVRAPEPEAEDAIYTLLQSNGWHEPTIRNLKKLDHPFQSDDPIMRACHEGATKRDGGIVVYSDPIEGA
jgi:hypothetical protein